MTALVLDSGALIAVDRHDRAMMARLRVAQAARIDLRTTGIIVAEVWRDPGGRQANLARVLEAVDVRPVDRDLGRAAGVLCAAAGAEAADATVVAVAAPGDTIITSDIDDMRGLVEASGLLIRVVAA